MQLEALTDAAFVHLRGMGKQNSIELEYNVYPRKADMPPDLHKARCVSQWHRNLQLLTVTRFCQVYMSRRIQLAESMWRLRGITREDAAGRYRMLLDNYRFWGAPVGMIITVDRHSLLLAEVFVCMEGQYSTAVGFRTACALLRLLRLLRQECLGTCRSTPPEHCSVGGGAWACHSTLTSEWDLGFSFFGPCPLDGGQGRSAEAFAP